MDNENNMHFMDLTELEELNGGGLVLGVAGGLLGGTIGLLGGTIGMISSGNYNPNILWKSTTAGALLGGGIGGILPA